MASLLSSLSSKGDFSGDTHPWLRFLFISPGIISLRRIPPSGEFWEIRPDRCEQNILRPDLDGLFQRLPPLSTEPDRCERAFVGNTIGEANGVYDKPLDLRFCDYTNDQTNLKGKTLSAALMSGAKFDGADMTEVVMSKAYVVGASFKGVNFSSVVIDRVNFGKSDLKGAVFKNTVLSGSTFDEANLEDVIFERTRSLVT